MPTGSRVQLTGLVNRPELNGRQGVVVADDERERVQVLLDGDSKMVVLKPKNLLKQKDASTVGTECMIQGRWAEAE